MTRHRTWRKTHKAIMADAKRYYALDGRTRYIYANTFGFVSDTDKPRAPFTLADIVPDLRYFA